MGNWNPNAYLRFGNERTQPSIDLASRVAVDSPARVIDLGCGPGNSTQVLRQRWPNAEVIGLDSSPHMIASAQETYPGQEWTTASIEEWRPDEPFDVVFSNAALQWVPDHGRLIPQLFDGVAPGGALAFQVPSATYALVRTLIHDIARTGPWAPRMEGPLTTLTMESPGFYYDCLATVATSVDIWETDYQHVMDSPGAIVDWIASTGLRPFLDALESDRDREQFESLLRERVAESYETRADGRVLFPFRRTFVIAYAR